MQKKILISWIVPAYNVETFVVQCLQSLISVGLPEDEYEILVVNDGSTDNTLGVIKNFAHKYPSIKVITQENQGLSASRNRAIELAKGEYIQFVDSDDYIVNGKQLAQCVEFANENNLDILTFELQKVNYNSRFNENEQKEIKDLTFSEIVDGQSYWVNYPAIYYVVTYFIKRQFVIENNLRFVPGLLLEDFQFNLNSFLLAKRCARTSVIFYSYRFNPNSIMHNASLEKQINVLKCMVTNAKYSMDFINKNDKKLKNGAKQVLKDRGNRMLIVGFIRAFKMDKVRYFNRELRENNLYPFEWMRAPEYQNKKARFFYKISQHENIAVFLSKLFKIYGRINPNALSFENW